MAWEPILWLIFFLLNIALIALILYQIVCLSDLEADYMNPYESSSRINNVILKEYVLQGVFCILFLVTGHWFLFLLTVLPTYYNLKKFLSRQHLIDVTEVFRAIDFEKKLRIAKLAFYLIFFIVVIVRLVISVIRCLIDDEHEDLHFGVFSSSPVFR
ncbi:protein cornichon homolog 1 isoform X2 [Ipomoea triloba]|uniref:protein cornichon homolog 1 isoform X2 n=1 Tax=Ipomoea triloba TaxID=35885 RepID=UPI00125DCE38|nr:protein cornichon homolog 1 isoform X2 [Ipomoea triloba]